MLELGRSLESELHVSVSTPRSILSLIVFNQRPPFLEYAGGLGGRFSHSRIFLLRFAGNTCRDFYSFLEFLSAQD